MKQKQNKKKTLCQTRNWEMWFAFENERSSWIWCQQHFPQKLGKAFVDRCVASAVIKLLCHVWDRFKGRNVFRFSLVRICWTVVQGGAVVARAGCGLALSCWSERGLPGQHIIGMAAIFTPTPVLLIIKDAIPDTSQPCHVCTWILIGTLQTHTHTHTQLCSLSVCFFCAEVSHALACNQSATRHRSLNDDNSPAKVSP